MASSTQARRNAYAREQGFSSYYAMRKAQAQAKGFPTYTAQRQAASERKQVFPTPAGTVVKSVPNAEGTAGRLGVIERRAGKAAAGDPDARVRIVIDVDTPSGPRKVVADVLARYVAMDALGTATAVLAASYTGGSWDGDDIRSIQIVVAP